jgi:hypothetical protein
MRDDRVQRLAGAQFNRISRVQLAELGMTPRAIARALDAGRLAIVEQGVFALPPVLWHDHWGRWMGATLTSTETTLSQDSAAAAWGFSHERSRVVTVTRPGNGGPRLHGGVLVYRSSTVDGHRTTHCGIPITTVPRTLLDLAARTHEHVAARHVREALRLKLTTLAAIAKCVDCHRGRRGSGRLLVVLGRYAGLPIERARSGAEVRALEVLRTAGFTSPALNVRIAGEEADLSWPAEQALIEVDGGPFHLDAGEDARKRARWESAGWTVERISADDVYDRPYRLVALATALNVPRCTP